MILNTTLLPSITRQFALKPQPPIVPVATDTVTDPIGDSFQKNTAVVPIPSQPKAGGRWLVALTLEQQQPFLQRGITQVVNVWETMINTVITKNPRVPESWIRLLLQEFKHQQLVETTKIVDMDILFRLFETTPDAVLRKALFPKLLNSTHPVVSRAAEDGKTLGETFITQLEQYLTENQLYYREYYRIPNFQAFEAEMAQKNKEHLTINGFSNAITQRLKGLMKPYPSGGGVNTVGIEVIPQFQHKRLIPLPVLTGFQVGIHPVEPLVRTPEQIAQIKKVLGIDLSKMPIVTLTPEQRFSENLNTAMRDIAIKDRLQEVVPTLTPEQLTFIPSEQIPIDETLLPTLKQLFPQDNTTS
jgi:hypothetical protein